MQVISLLTGLRTFLFGYAINQDYGTFQVEKGSLVDTSYTLYDRQAIERVFDSWPFS